MYLLVSADLWWFLVLWFSMREKMTKYFSFEAEENHKVFFLLFTADASWCNQSRRPAAGGVRPSCMNTSDGSCCKEKQKDLVILFGFIGKYKYFVIFWCSKKWWHFYILTRRHNFPKYKSVSYYHILYVSNLFFTQQFKNRHEKSVECFWKPVILENRRMFQKIKVLVMTRCYMYSTYFWIRNSKIGMINRKQVIL